MSAFVASPPRSLRLVVPRYGETVVGGSEGLSRALATALAERGWSVEVCTTTAVEEATWAGNLRAGEEREAGVAVRRFPVTVRRWPWLFEQGSRVFFRLPSALRPERAWFLAQGPVSPALIRYLGAAPGRPTLFTPYLYRPTIRGIHRASHPRLLMPAAHDEPPLPLRLVGRAVAAADGLLYHAPEEREVLERAHPIARQRPYEVGTVAVEPPSSIDPRRFRSRSGIDGPYLIYGGRAARAKRLGDLCSGVRLLRRRRPDVTLVLTGEAGTGMPAQEGVAVTGRLGDRERWEAIAGAAAVVAPGSLESLSLIALEGWAAGRPCLLNAASPVLRGQSERSGGALTYRGPQGLAEAADRLLGDASLSARLGAAGRDYVRTTYSWDGVAARLERLITRAGGAPSP